MKIVGTSIYLSASDISTHMYCSHATFLNVQAAKNLLKAPHYHDPNLIALQEKGEQFEENYVEELKRSGKSVVEIRGDHRKQAVADTIAAMQRGADIIYQARLESGQWNGCADFLIKVENQSDLGNWSYEVLDTKLSKETKTGAILHRRSLAESTMFRFKMIFGDSLTSRIVAQQQVEVKIKCKILNQMTGLARPNSYPLKKVGQ